MADTDTSIENRKIFIRISITILVIAIIATIIYFTVFHNKSNNNNLNDNNKPTLTMPPLKQNIDEIPNINNNTQQKNNLSIKDEILDIYNEPYFTTTPQTTPQTTTPQITTTTPQITTTPQTTTPRTTTPRTTTPKITTKEQEIINNLTSQQAELERAIELLKEKEKEDLFNIPLIPVFNSHVDEAVIPSEGFYQIRQFYEYSFPYFFSCYNIGPAVDGVSPGWSNGGKLGCLLDNNETTGIYTMDHCNQKCIAIPYIIECTPRPYDAKSPLIIITMPVMKTFKGKLKMSFNSPPHIKGVLPNMIINTTNNITNDTFRYSDDDILSILRYRSKPWLESVELEINSLDSYKSAYWDLNFTKPFRCIIFEIISCKTWGYSIWITGISFEKSR